MSHDTEPQPLKRVSDSEDLEMSHLLSFDASIGDRDSFDGSLNWRVLLALALNLAAWVATLTINAPEKTFTALNSIVRTYHRLNGRKAV